MNRWSERMIEAAIRFSGFVSIAFVVMIFLFLLTEGHALFRVTGLTDFLLGRNWHPISTPPQFGILPLLLGSLAVTAGASMMAVPLGIGTAVFIAEVAPKRLAGILKVGVELIAAIPSVVIGFVGMVLVAPVVREFFSLPVGLTAFTGSLMLALMSMPTMVSIAEDAIHAVPRQYKEAALAMGATRWQAIYRVILPAARPGILAAVMLGIGRVVGETMAVMMCTGGAVAIPSTLLQPVRTMTATIAAEMGETVRGSPHYNALFAIGIVLFLITLIINVTADLVIHRGRRDSP
ncbi:MAG: phosphate ABC transporter permease subunit PstC [Planctomycetes bacterium]|nr:phosphate ABC transporter permease subunit PstC [Planctomycetota bacterium]